MAFPLVEHVDSNFSTVQPHSRRDPGYTNALEPNSTERPIPPKIAPPRVVTRTVFESHLPKTGDEPFRSLLPLKTPIRRSFCAKAHKKEKR